MKLTQILIICLLGTVLLEDSNKGLDKEDTSKALEEEKEAKNNAVKFILAVRRFGDGMELSKHVSLHECLSEDSKSFTAMVELVKMIMQHKWEDDLTKFLVELSTKLHEFAVGLKEQVKVCKRTKDELFSYFSQLKDYTFNMNYVMEVLAEITLHLTEVKEHIQDTIEAFKKDVLDGSFELGKTVKDVLLAEFEPITGHEKEIDSN